MSGGVISGLQIVIFTVIAFLFSFIGGDMTANAVRFRFLGMSVIYLIIQMIVGR